MKKEKVTLLTKYILIIISVFGVISLVNSLRELYDKNEFENIVKNENIDPTTGLEYTSERKLNYVFKPKIRRLIQSNPNIAISYIDSIMEIYPKSEILHFDKAMAYYEIDSFQRAIKEFNIVIEKDSTPHITALRFKNDCLIQLNQYDESIEILNKLVEFNEIYNVDLGQVYEWKKDYKNAVKYYEKVLSLWENSENKERYWLEIRKVKEKIKELK